MSIVRENYYVPLWNLAKVSAGFATASRKVRLLQDMEDSELPAIFMALDHELTTQAINSPAEYRLGAKIYLYCANPSQEIAADMALNALIDALELALQPSPGFGSQNLGRDDVQGAWIAGEVEIYPAPNGTRAAAIVPIQIHVFG